MGHYAKLTDHCAEQAQRAFNGEIVSMESSQPVWGTPWVTWTNLITAPYAVVALGTPRLCKYISTTVSATRRSWTLSGDPLTQRSSMGRAMTTAVSTARASIATQRNRKHWLMPR